LAFSIVTSAACFSSLMIPRLSNVSSADSCRAAVTALILPLDFGFGVAGGIGSTNAPFAMAWERTFGSAQNGH
jgi:hypothetical protein